MYVYCILCLYERLQRNAKMKKCQDRLFAYCLAVLVSAVRAQVKVWKVKKNTDLIIFFIQNTQNLFSCRHFIISCGLGHRSAFEGSVTECLVRECLVHYA